MDRISAYISLLFLTADSDYDLEQDEFYSDLYVVKRPEPSNNEFYQYVENAQNVLKNEDKHGTVEIQN